MQKMPFNADIKRHYIAVIALATIALSACSKQEITLSGKEDRLGEASVTRGENVVVYPDSSPSTADGKTAWKQMNCAVCHADNGKGVPGKCAIDLTDKGHAHKQKPIDQFKFISFGKPGSNHVAVSDKLSRRLTWALVFYVRSFADAPLTDAQVMDVDAVFGSNCAVCHGKQGVGDGPLGRNFEPKPANFRNFARFYDRSDDVLWDHIANGIKWEGMPDFLGKEDKAKNIKFDNEYIWKLVQYVRHFHETTQPTLAEVPNKPETKAKGK